MKKVFFIGEIMEIILASSNVGKKIELEHIFNQSGISIKNVLKEELLDIKETGSTFKENASIKALAYAKHFNQVAIADDSGLSVEYLYGLPGLNSARYSGLGDKINNQKLLDALKNTQQRNAYFTSFIALAFPDGKLFTYEGIWHGHIAEAMQGTQGFGYDSVFIPEGNSDSVGTFDITYKNKHSHRARAMKLLMEDKDEIINYWRYTWQRGYLK